MNDKTNFPQGLEIMLRLMFSFVGANYDTFEFKEQWYWEYEWTEKQEKEFEKLYCYLLKNSIQIRKDIMGTSIYKTDDVFKKSFTMFNLQYGWKTKKESE